LLDPVERTRLAGFRSPADAALYLVTHALARIVLGARIGIPPAEIEIDRTCRHCGEPHGKPAVAGLPVHFSLAHSGSLAVVAVGAGHPIGVDVEDLRQRVRVTSLAQAALSAPERRDYDRLPAGHRHRSLLTYWTRKEAVLKAVGDGLATRPTEIHVTPPGATPRLLHRPAHWPDAQQIHLADLNPPGPHVAALAGLNAPPQVVERDGAAMLAALSA
jgi:4'-phosphopantetheinyl transferase